MNKIFFQFRCKNLTGGFYPRGIFWGILSAGDFLGDFIRGGFYPLNNFFAGDFILRGILSAGDFFLDPILQLINFTGYFAIFTSSMDRTYIKIFFFNKKYSIC